MQQQQQAASNSSSTATAHIGGAESQKPAQRGSEQRKTKLDTDGHAEMSGSDEESEVETGVEDEFVCDL